MTADQGRAMLNRLNAIADQIAGLIREVDQIMESAHTGEFEALFEADPAFKAEAEAAAAKIEAAFP